LLRDVSDWDWIGYGGKSTLEKEELLSPEQIKYLIKYPRNFQVGVSWEDITELIAAEIGSILGMETMEVEIVTRNGRRGCLLKNFTAIPGLLHNEEGGSLLNVFDDYQLLLETTLTGEELIDFGFDYIRRLPFWNSIKSAFIDMQFFDILIGNQDRHPYNWLILFFSENNVKFSPFYDNGASLGFRFDDQKLLQMIENESLLNKYTKNTKVKAGIFERKQVKAKDLLNYLLNKFPEESKNSIHKLMYFEMDRYVNFIHSVNVLSEAQKKWLLHIIPFRRNKILEWVGKEGL
jgi:hypothetical protein